MKKITLSIIAITTFLLSGCSSTGAGSSDSTSHSIAWIDGETTGKQFYLDGRDESGLQDYCFQWSMAYVSSNGQSKQSDFEQGCISGGRGSGSGED